MKKIAVIIGSLQKNSFNRKTAQVLIELAPESLSLSIVEIGQLQMYNQDLEETTPIEWTSFREKIKGFDGILFVTPEHNRSLPAALKNALDIASRPYGENVWNGKPGAIVSVSPGPLGGFGVSNHLRQVLTTLNIQTMQQPEAYIGLAMNLFDEKGVLINDSTRNFLQRFISAYAKWVEIICREK